VRDAGPTNSTPGSIITNSAGGTANRLRGTYFGPGGVVNQFVFGDLTFPAFNGTAVPLRTRGGDRRVNDSGRNIGLEPRDDRYGVFGRVSFEITDGIELFAEAALQRRRCCSTPGRTSRPASCSMRPAARRRRCRSPATPSCSTRWERHGCRASPA
jgi:hypothetical protein